MAGYASTDGELVVDFLRMCGVKVDRAGETAWVQCGAVCGNVLVETLSYGLWLRSPVPVPRRVSAGRSSAVGSGRLCFG
ncbi:hypothetical protein GCM10027597_26080 [Saccharopolyspora tripterygii]